MYLRRSLSFVTLLSLFAALLPFGWQSANAQSSTTVTIDGGTRFQTIDGFGTCLGGTEAQQQWWQDLYYGDLGASILRVDLTPRLKSPYSDNTYNSPWFHNNPSLPGPDGNNVRTYTGPNDYSRLFNNKNTPIAVMKPDIEQNIGFFDYAAELPKTGGTAAQAGVARKAQLGDFKLVASFWSPVPWVKVTSGNRIGNQSGIFPTNGTPWPFIWFDNFAGGKLDVSGTPLAVFNDGMQNTSSLTQYARSTAAYVLGYQRTYSVRFYAISIQNELNFEQFYNSAYYPLSSQYITALKAVRAEFDKYPELRDIKLMGPEDLMGSDVYGMWEYGGPVHKNLQYLQNIAADPQAAAALSFFNIHSYAADGSSSAGSAAQLWDWWANGWTTAPAGGIPANVKGFKGYNKKSWQTETSGEATDWLSPSTGFPGGGAWSIALKMQQALTIGGQSAWLYWQTSDGSAVKGETLTDSTARASSAKYVAFKHFTKYIRPGAVRVAANVNGSSTLSASAFVHDANKTVTTVLVNSGATAQTITVRLPATPSGIGSLQTFTSSNGSLWQSGTASVNNGTVTVTVPGYGVTTLYGTGSSTTQSTVTPPPSVTPVPGGTGTGLRAEYFNNTTLSGSAALVRTDAQVNNDWGNGGPGAPIGSDNFSARWTGQIEAPVAGSYTFATTSDDGIRLWLNNQQVINNWTDHGPTTDTAAAITLSAGQRVDVRMEYYEKTGGAIARLLWAYPGQTQQAIPQSRLYPATATTPTNTPVAPTSTPVPPTATSVPTAPPSGNTTITFESATNNSYAVYTESNYRFRDAGSDPVLIYGTAQGYASKVLHPSNWNAKLLLTRSDGGAFNLVSFDYAASTFGDAGDALVTGTRSDGTSVTQSYSFSSKSLRTLTLNWTNLTQVTIDFAGGTNAAYGAIDTVVVNTAGGPAPSAPPAPTNTAAPTSAPTTAPAPSSAVNRVRFYPRSGMASRMNGGKITVSNTSQTNDFVTLATLNNVVDNQWNEITFANTTAYRYVKYEAPPESYGAIAELELYNGSTRLNGTGFGTAGSWNNSGNTFDKALDGNTATFFDAPTADNNYVGLDLGSAVQVGAPSFSPTPGSYSAAQNVTISTATSGASIRYTTDGSTPTCSSGTLGSSLNIAATTTVRAIACKSGLADSTVTTGVYTIGTGPTPPPSSSVSRVYHIGNSLTDTINYNAMRSLTQSKGNMYDFGRHMIPGAPLEFIWNNPTGGISEPPYGFYTNALPNYTWDAVTLQPFDRQIDSDTDYAKRFIDLARQRAANSNTQFYIFSHWMRKNSDGTLNYDQAWLRPYTGGWDGSNETKDYFEKLVTRLRNETSLSKPVLMVPVGDVMYELNQRMKAGRVPGYSDITQFYADGIHLNNVGQFMTAATFYATMYKTDPHGASYAAFNTPGGTTINDALATAIYDAVWDVVRNHPYAGLR